MKTDPPRIVGNLTLDTVLESDEALNLIKEEDLADPFGEQTQASLGHLGSFSHVALLTFPSTPEQPVPDRLLLPLNPTGYGPACFLRAIEYGGCRLGRPRPLNDRTAAAIASAAADLLGWPAFEAPKAPKTAKASKRAKKKFNPNDRTRRDLPIYLDILTELGEPVPSEEVIAATPLCDLLRSLHARVIEKSPLQLIDMVANGKGGALSEYVKQFEPFYPCVAVRWSGGIPMELACGDNSAYRHLLGCVYTCLVKAKKGKSNWFKKFNPAKGGIVEWMNDKIKTIALRQINDPKGGRILTPDHTSCDANPVVAALTPDTALAFGPSAFDPTEANQTAAITRIRHYLNRMDEIPLSERRRGFRELEDQVGEYYQFDDRTKAELGAELAEARARHLRVAAVAEGSADLAPKYGITSRDNLRAAKVKAAANRPTYEAWDFSNDDFDPYAQPVAAETIAAKTAEFWERLSKSNAAAWEKTRETLRATRPVRRKPKADPNQFLLFPDPAEPVPGAPPKVRSVPRPPANFPPAPAALVGPEPTRSVPKPQAARRRKEADPNQLWLPLDPLSDASPKPLPSPKASARPEPAPPLPVGTLGAFFNSQTARLERRGSPAAVHRPRVRGPDPARVSPRAVLV